jgi:hypothetical protein
MKWTKWVEKTRKKRLEEAYGGWQSGRLTEDEAARYLGVFERTFRGILVGTRMKGCVAKFISLG